MLASLLSLGWGSAAQADINADMNYGDNVSCIPAKKLPKVMRKLNEIDASNRGVVDVEPMPKFFIKDGGGWPERLFVKTEKSEIDIPIDRSSGLTPTFLKTVMANASGEICLADQARAGHPINNPGLAFDMGLLPVFHNHSGRHDLVELEKGAQDGRQFYKKMIPSAIRLFLPDTKHISVRYDDLRLTSQIFARVGDQEIPLVPERFRNMHVVSLKKLMDMGASELLVKGGEYQLKSTLSAKNMKRFSWKSEDEK